MAAPFRQGAGVRGYVCARPMAHWCSVCVTHGVTFFRFPLGGPGTASHWPLPCIAPRVLTTLHHPSRTWSLHCYAMHWICDGRAVSPPHESPVGSQFNLGTERKAKPRAPSPKAACFHCEVFGCLVWLGGIMVSCATARQVWFPQ